ncbi:MAG: hypothetical protein LQ338_004950 [Usnochroma carphineum]|nr:MAG: hypothetical protein LQ338_004950 [Usnochroma carphineum]
MPPAPPQPTPKPPKPDWVETETGNKVSRRSQLHGTQHITLGGRCVIHPTVCIRGDLVRPPPPPPDPSNLIKSKTPLTSVSLGKYTVLNPGALLRPPSRPSKSHGVTYHPLYIGSHTWVGADAVLEAAQVGDHVVIEEGVVVGKMAILKDGCRVLRGCVVPPGMVVAAGLVVGGRPARVVGEVGVGWGVGEDEGGGGWGGGLREVWRGVGREG